MPNVTVSASDNFSPGDIVISSQGGFLEEPVTFPLGLVSTVDLLNYTNTFPSSTTPTLQAGILPTDQSLTLVSGTGVVLPLTAFEVSIDDEIIFVTTRSGDTLNGLVRGAEGTTPFTHVIGSNVQLLITAKGHNKLVSEIISIENFLGKNGSNVTSPTPTEVVLNPVSAGDFQVAHGIGKTPKYAVIQMTSNGLIRFQTTRYDSTFLYLNASDVNLTGYAEVFG